MEDPGPLALFPLEIWEMILDRVLDSETVYKVLQIYPQLDEAFQKKKHVWLLGKILPFVTTWTNMLDDEEVLKLRYGCKNWIQQVDNFLENQPQLRPYQPDLQTDDEFLLNSKAHFNQHRNEGADEVEKSYFGGVNFDLNDHPENNVEKFMKKMSTHPVDRNPFLARCVTVQASCWENLWRMRGREEVGPEPRRLTLFLENVLDVLEKFGQHIWFYSIELRVKERLRGQVWHWFTRSIGLLPNLKSLDVYFEITSDGNAQEQESSDEESESDSVINLPPSLESLRVSGSTPDAYAVSIVGGLQAPIRRLNLHFDSWRDDYTRLLSAVTEFKLEGIKIRTIEKWTRFRNFFLSLEAPQLVKLELDLFNLISKYNQSAVFIEDDIFSWIRRFPYLKYFDVGFTNRDFFIQERGTLLPERDSLPSLQFLSIRDSIALSYNFLICLPSLLHLQIQTDAKPEVVDLSNEKEVKIREQIETGTLHTSNIWELLPSLRSVSILTSSELGVVEYSCDREKVNYFKEHPDYQGFDDCRKDICRWLEPQRPGRVEVNSDFDSDEDLIFVDELGSSSSSGTDDDILSD